MEYLHQFLDIILHLDQHLQNFVSLYGTWVYALLFAIIFFETAFIVTPFLPGDSLLFAAGSIAAISELNVHWLALLLSIAAIVGDSINYAIGHWVGPKIFSKEDSLLFNRKYLIRAEEFYEKYGGKTIIIARFIPIIRTFAPFVAGIGSMNYRRFLSYNIIGGLLWVYSFLYVSYWFGNLEMVKNNFSLIILGIIIVSLLPPLFDIYFQKKKTMGINN